MLNTGSLDDGAVWGGSGNGRWDLASGSRSLGPYLAPTLQKVALKSLTSILRYVIVYLPEMDNGQRQGNWLSWVF